MRRHVVIVLAAAGVLAPPEAARADVVVRVPAAFVGGPIRAWSPTFGPGAPGGWAGTPGLAPDRCRDAAPGDCAVLGPGDADDDPPPVPTPGPGGVGDPVNGVGVEAEPPPDEDTAELAAEAARVGRSPTTATTPGEAARVEALRGALVGPVAAWVAGPRPTLRWRAAPAAAAVRVDVMRGPRRVVHARVRGTRLRVPAGALRRGRAYLWTVRPVARTGRARGDPPLGWSVFAVALRPRIVFRTPGDGAGTVGEVRPRIPLATLRLSRPGALARRVPRLARLDRRGRFRLSISSRAAERLGAVLVDRGPTPPAGLRGPGL